MIDRREFLEAVAAAGVAAFAGAAALALPGCGREDPLEPALRGFFAAHREAAREVGREVLALDPDAEPGVLVERVARRRGAELRALARSDPESLADLLRAQHRADLAEGRVVAVRGWLLSETEAWLLALAAAP
jgi:hypothetical protein